MTQFGELRRQYQGTKVLVTGATGFLGTHLCRALFENGAEVFAVSRTSHNSDNKSLHWHQTDLTDIHSVRQMFERVRPDMIFHFSGTVSAATGLDLILPTYQSLLSSTVCLLTSAAELGCKRFVIPGSLTEPAPGPIDIVPGSPYAMAKWASSTYGRMFFKLYQTPVVIARPFMTYGPGQPSSKLIPYVLRSALRGDSPEIASGPWKADWIYVDDVTDGLLMTGCTPGIDGMSIDLGSGALTSVHDIVEKAIALTGGKVKPVFDSSRDRPFQQVRVADTAGAYAALGWKARISLNEGLDRTIRALRQELREGEPEGQWAN